MAFDRAIDHGQAEGVAVSLAREGAGAGIRDLAGERNRGRVRLVLECRSIEDPQCLADSAERPDRLSLKQQHLGGRGSRVDRGCGQAFGARMVAAEDGEVGGTKQDLRVRLDPGIQPPERDPQLVLWCHPAA